MEILDTIKHFFTYFRRGWTWASVRRGIWDGLGGGWGGACFRHAPQKRWKTHAKTIVHFEAHVKLERLAPWIRTRFFRICLDTKPRFS